MSPMAWSLFVLVLMMLYLPTLIKWAGTVGGTASFGCGGGSCLLMPSIC